jgi:hypothetical protein
VPGTSGCLRQWSTAPCWRCGTSSTTSPAGDGLNAWPGS